MVQRKTLKGFCEIGVEGATYNISTHRSALLLRISVRGKAEYIVASKSPYDRVTARVAISALCHAALTRFLLRAIIEQLANLN